MKTVDNFNVDELRAEIGHEYTQKFLTAFVLSLKELGELLNSEQDIDQLQRVGHKFKSSAKTIGAKYFASLCENLEDARSEKIAAHIVVLLQKEIPILKNKIENAL